MIARMLTRLLFGSEWSLKLRCQRERNGIFQRFARGLYSWLQYENTSGISWNAKFAGEPCFPHGMKAIFISGGAVLGRDCVIFQQVTIGSNTLIDSKGFGAPVIGDRCYIGAGAKIIGRVTVGDDVRIGANAVVTRDVPSGSVVVAGQQVVKLREGLDNRYVSFRGRWMYFTNGEWRSFDSPDQLAAIEGLVEREPG